MDHRNFWTYRKNKVISPPPNSSGVGTSCESLASVFGDADCGEPFEPQELVIDFTPTEEDTEETFEKVLAFWDFVRRQPELEAIVAPFEPGSETCVDHSKDQLDQQSENVEWTDIQGPTAVSVLGDVEDAGLIERAFETKIPQSRCSGEQLDYCDRSPTTMTKSLRKKGCSCKPGCRCRICERRVRKTLDQPAAELCRELKDWDDVHPKSMDPPGHPPALSHAIMQRKI